MDRDIGKDGGKTSVIIGALNGLKSAVVAFRSHFARCRDSMGYESCKTNQGLWQKPEIRPKDGAQNFSYCEWHSLYTPQFQ